MLWCNIRMMGMCPLPIGTACSIFRLAVGNPVLPCFVVAKHADCPQPRLTQSCTTPALHTCCRMLPHGISSRPHAHAQVQLQSKVKKSLTLRDFKARAAAASGIPVEQQRWWTWHRRSNHTFRPSSILTVPGDDDSVGMLSTKPAYTQYNPQPVQVSLLLEKAATPLITNAALLFLKFYDPVKAQLSVRATPQDCLLHEPVNETSVSAHCSICACNATVPREIASPEL